MKDAARTAWSSFIYWKLAIIRCLLYGVMVGWGVFKAGTQGYDHWSDMSAFQKVWLFGDMFVAFGGVVLAFLDNSMQRLSPDATSAQITTETQTTITPKT